MSTFLTVLGPPGSGKSALTNALSSPPDIRVFRLRDFCLTQERRDPTLAGQLRNSPDPSGWLDDVAVGEVLAKAFHEQWFPSRTARVVLLENFPGNARQVELLLGVHVITTTNGLGPAAKKLRQLEPSDFAYVQISLDGGSPSTHDAVRGEGAFAATMATVSELAGRGFDTRIICTVNRANANDCLRLLDVADELGVSLVKYHVFSTIGRGHGNPAWAMEPPEWIAFYERLEQVAQGYRTRVWYQPTYARRERIAGYATEGYRGCIGRTLDRISIFPDGRCYVCSYLFDTDLHFATMRGGTVTLNKAANEFDLFTGALTNASCGGCKAASAWMGGCPAEEVVMGASSCATYPEIVPVCRLWKSDVAKGDR